MIRLLPIWALARAESRLAFRLVRYWIFLVLATLFGIFQWGQFYFIHHMFSANSASAAAINPRYFVGNFGGLIMLVFVVGLIFLGFDVRARDKRERIDEVVDTTPVSNLEFVLGRALGILIAAWVPLTMITLALAGVTWMVSAPIEPVSLIGFLFLMMIPGFVFSTGLVFLVTLIVRTRLLAAIASVILLVLLFVTGIWWIPFYVTPLTDITGGYAVSFPSDLIPSLSNLAGWIQRLGYALMGLGMLWFAAAIHPRKDDSRRPLLAVTGAGMLAAGLALCGWQVLDRKATFAQQDAWRTAHRERATDPIPSIRAISGDVTIDPGRAIEMQIDVRITPQGEQTLDAALFSLNPGLTVNRIDLGGSQLEFTHDDGLLDVKLPVPLDAGEQTTLAMSITGVPDPTFAYLDASIEMMLLNPSDAQIYILGFDTWIFDKRYVALMPGIRWLPAAGTEFGRDDPKTRAPDYFKVDLRVAVPDSWLVAGPGRDTDDAGAHRFNPSAPVPQVALITAPFESWSTEVEGVELQLMLHPRHAANAEFFDDSVQEIEEWLGNRLRQADDVGLPYPYGALTLVEVPNSLRGFGGGWRMDSTLIQPAMILLRESSFPTADFNSRNDRFERAADEEGGTARAKREALEQFFENDVNGGNPFLAAARSFFGFQTTGIGPEALPLDYVWENLTSELVTDSKGFFSVHFFNPKFGQEFMMAGQAMNEEDRISDSYAEVLIHRIVSTPEVWETVMQTSLLDLDPRRDPERAINVLGLKGTAMAESMLDDLGREKTGRFLAALRSEHQGKHYTREDVVAAGETIDEDLSAWIELWIDETALPGLMLDDVRYHRLADAEDGSMQFQLLITVQNGESAPGMFRLEYRVEDQAGNRWQRAEPVRIDGNSAVEVGLVTSNLLRVARVAPYLALNRDPFNVQLPPVDQEKIVREEPFSGARATDWSVPQTDIIVVDDLDPGFAVQESDGSSGLRIGGRGNTDEVLDHGLPIAEQGLSSADRWSRMKSADAFGRYRRTMAVVKGGEGKRTAKFTATLPHAGQWELDYYFTGFANRRSRSMRTPGKWKLVIEDSSGTREIEFDADGAETGWNSLGRFEMATGEAVVRVSDETDGDYVQADAIRWKPLTGGSQDTVASATPRNR